MADHEHGAGLRVWREFVENAGTVRFTGHEIVEAALVCEASIPEHEAVLIAAAVALCRDRREKPSPPTVTGPHGEIKGEYHMAGQGQAALDLAREIGKLTSLNDACAVYARIAASLRLWAAARELLEAIDEREQFSPLEAYSPAARAWRAKYDAAEGDLRAALKGSTDAER